MVCFANYELTVPKSNSAFYVEHVLRKIYGFDENDLWFLNAGASNNNVKLYKETEEAYIIRFRICTFITLVNVLPPTVVQTTKEICLDQQVYELIKDRIEDEVQSAHDDLARLHRQKTVDSDKLFPAICQLTREGVISKFVSLDSPDQFICVSQDVPLLVASIQGKLVVDIINNVFFDVDDGFIGDLPMKNLNGKFKEWKARGDFAAPVLQQNVITDDMLETKPGMISGLVSGLTSWLFSSNSPEERNQNAIEFGDKLMKDGHTCVMHLESYPVQISWCRENPCVNKSKCSESNSDSQDKSDSTTITDKEEDLGWVTSGYCPPKIEYEEPPKIMTMMCDLLKAQGHECVMIIGMKNHEFKWCQKQVCPEAKIRANMAQRNHEAHEFADKLRQEGHRCISYMESYPVQIGWCEQTPCIRAEKCSEIKVHKLEPITGPIQLESPDSMAERNRKAMEFGDKLVRDGHECVEHLESYPVQISWCNKTPCAHKSKQDDRSVSVSDSEDETDEEDRNNRELVAKLEKEGHVCVRYSTSPLGQIKWCQETPCGKRYKFDMS